MSLTFFELAMLLRFLVSANVVAVTQISPTMRSYRTTPIVWQWYASFSRAIQPLCDAQTETIARASEAFEEDSRPVPVDAELMLDVGMDVPESRALPEEPEELADDDLLDEESDHSGNEDLE